MSNDLITLLRQGWRGETATDLMREAASEIERLTAKLDAVMQLMTDNEVWAFDQRTYEVDADAFDAILADTDEGNGK